MFCTIYPLHVELDNTIASVLLSKVSENACDFNFLASVAASHDFGLQIFQVTLRYNNLPNMYPLVTINRSQVIGVMFLILMLFITVPMALGWSTNAIGSAGGLLGFLCSVSISPI